MPITRTRALLGDLRMLNYTLVAYYVLTYSATTVLVIRTSLSLLGKSAQSFYTTNIHGCVSRRNILF